MVSGRLALLWAALLVSPSVTRAADAADDLASRFAQYCMADPSPYKAANDAANAGKLEIDKGLTGVDMPNPSHIVTTQTWHAGTLAATELSLVATNVDSGKCRVQVCGLVAQRLKGVNVEAALTKRLGLPAPASRSEDNVAIQIAWSLKTPAGRVVSFAAQKSLAGNRVTLTVAQLCSQS